VSGQRRLLLCLALCCAVFVTFLSFWHKDEGRIIVVQDAFDPLHDLLKPYADDRLHRLNPYQLAHELPSLTGMAFVFGTQARAYQNQFSSDYVPLYSAVAVIAVNRDGNAADAIDGWHTLIASDAVVLMPHNATEGGRLAAIAMAQGLGGSEGDFTPALNAFAYLNEQGRLNPQSEYKYDGYNYMFYPDNVSAYDAIVMWDYQARRLKQISDQWDIVVPNDGAFEVDCGFVYSGSSGADASLLPLKNFLLSEQGRQALIQAGFSPLNGIVDLSGWSVSRLTYNPKFRRSVLSVKLTAPASVLEKLTLQCATLLLFCIAAQKVLRRIAQGARRSSSFYAMLIVALWLLIGIVKTLTLHHDFTRYCWFATYIPRHYLPICWYLMCYANRYDAFPPRKRLILLSAVAGLLTLFVFTNDLHHQIFIYSFENPATWGNAYSYGWGYYLSLLWSLQLCAAGFNHIIRNKMTRYQRRQMLYVGMFLLILLAYQICYMAGMQSLIDFDIPTTIAILFLIFNAVLQKQRFMGASLLELPVFKHSSYAIAISDNAGHVVYHNSAMALVSPELIRTLSDSQSHESALDICVGEQVFKPHIYALDAGRALVLENITDLRRLEHSLQETRQRLNSVQALLLRQAQMTEKFIGSFERERFYCQMEMLFNKRIHEAQRCLDAFTRKKYQNKCSLKCIRFLICICQQRLRFIIQSLEARPHLSIKLVQQYAAKLLTDGRRLGVDGVVTGSLNGTLPSDIAPALLEFIDCLCLYCFHPPAASFICFIETSKTGTTLHACQSWELGIPANPPVLLTKPLRNMIKKLHGQIQQTTDEDGLITELCFPHGEALV